MSGSEIKGTPYLVTQSPYVLSPLAELGIGAYEVIIAPLIRMTSVRLTGLESFIV